MSIRVTCEHCGTVLKVKNQLAGTIGKCPECKHKLIVPNASGEEDAADPAAETQPVAKIPALPRIEKNGSRPAVAPSSAASASPAVPPPAAPVAPVIPKTPPAAAAPPVPAKPATPPAPPAATAAPPAPPTLPPAPPTLPPAPPAAAAPPDSPAPAGDDFDVDAYLADTSNPHAKKSAGLSAGAEAGKAPLQDKFGRRSISAAGGIGAKGGDSAAAAAAQQELTGGKPGQAPPPADGSSVVVVSSVQPKERVKLTPRQKKRALIIAASSVVASVAGFFVSAWLMKPHIDLPVLAPVEGRVTVKNDKGERVGLANVLVSLLPVQSEGLSASGQKIGLRVASGITDSAGNYKAYYLEGAPGTGMAGAPVNTKVRLAVTPLHPRDVETIPERFQRPEISGDLREIRPVGNSGKFDIEL